MYRSGADWVVAALIIGLALASAVLVLALLVTLSFSRSPMPLRHRVNVFVGRVLMFITASAMLASLFLTILALGLEAWVVLMGSRLPVTGEAAVVCAALSLAIAPLLKRRLVLYIRSWPLMALVLTVSICLAVLMSYPLS